MDRFAREVGRALRAARKARGLTLRRAAERSGGRFRPTSIAGYERGERAISLERFVELARLYDVRPDRLLADVLRELEGRPPAVIDLTRLEALQEPERRIVAGFVQEVISLRNEPRGEAVTLRAGDLEVLATAMGVRPPELIERIRTVLRTEGRGLQAEEADAREEDPVRSP